MTKGVTVLTIASLLVILAASVPEVATTRAPARPGASDTDAAVVARPSGWIFLGPEDSGFDPATHVWRGEQISLSLKNADIRDVLVTFAKLADINLVLDPGVRGQVTVELTDVPWDQALYVILKTHGLAGEIDGAIWTVERPRQP